MHTGNLISPWVLPPSLPSPLPSPPPSPSCLEEGEDGRFHCPVCQSDNQTVIAVLQELDSVTNINEDFHRQVGGVPGGGAHRWAGCLGVGLTV